MDYLWIQPATQKIVVSLVLACLLFPILIAVAH